ncbi:DUF481 domain-containing protein [Vibrio hannami]|uniref:DUF481 domain-containing protein n=1 Tax=Vibrio hannami TaxID=2717094 RepID=UPI003BB0652B
MRLLLLTILISPLAYAEETAEDKGENSPLSTEIEFGYQSHSGNSDTESLNARGDLEYISGRHRYSGELKLYKLDKDGVEDKRQASYQAQTDYKLGSNLYLYGNFKGVDSKYSAYFKDYTLSGGLGYQTSFSSNMVIELELGPGYRYQEPNLDEIDDDDIIFPNVVKEPIVRSNVNLSWQILDSLALSADLTMTAGSSNSNLDSEVSVINNVTDDIALKLTHSRQYHDKVPEGLSNTDSIFTVNLLFLF